MGCDIIFKFTARGSSEEGPQQLPKITNSSISSQDFNIHNVAKLLLYKEDFRKQLADIYKQNQYIGVQNVNEKVLNEKGVMGNLNLQELKNSFSHIQWHNGTTVYNPEILLVKRFSIGGKLFTGRIIDGNREVFVIQNSEASLKKFNNFLTFRDKFIQDQDVLESNDKLKEVSKNYGFKTNADLLIDYLLDSEKYTENIEHYSIINDAISEYQKTDFINIRDNFSSALINSGEKGKYGTYFISKQTFNDLLKEYHPEIFEKYNIDKKILAKSNVDEELIKQIFNEVFKNDPDSGYHVSFLNSRGKGMLLKVSSAVEDVYGFTYKTIYNDLHEVEDQEGIQNHSYRGYNIYYVNTENGPEYYCSLDVLSSAAKAQGKRLHSIEEVKQFIDKQYNINNSIHSTVNLGFKFEQTSTEEVNVIDNESYHPVGSIVKSLDITLNPFVNIDINDYTYLHDKHLLKETKEVFKKQIPEDYHSKFEKIIDTSEKMGVFIHLLNERIGDRSKRDFSNSENLTILSGILDNIQNAEGHYKYYFITKADKIDTTPGKHLKSYNVYRYKVIPVSGSRIEYDEYYERPEPIVSQLEQIADVLKDKFGLKVTILNSREIPNGIPPDAKAWIKNGEIFVNGTIAGSNDLMHEYSHLLLGVLKSVSFEKYEKLIDKIRTSQNGSILEKRRQLKHIYKDLSDTDLNEEIFADLFGEYLSKGNISVMFNELDAVKSDISSEFENKFNITDVGFDALLRGKLINVFRNLNTLITRKDGIQFGNTSKYRKASRKIEELIKNKEIREIC